MGNLNRFKAKNGLDSNSLTIINVADPINAQDAATKNFSANASNITTGTLAVARGGTGGADAASARTSLGLAIGTNVQAWDADLDAIAALTGTTGLLKKTAANTWSLDTSSYLTTNQTITVSGDATGSGTTAITLTLANTAVTTGTYRSVTVDSKGRVTAGTNPTTISGYGITDAYTKTEVDNLVTGLDMKQSVRAATTANITLSGTQTIDGIAMAAGDRVLVKDQTTGSQNGIYVVAAGAWSRATDADNSPSGEVTAGMYVFVVEGTTNADTGWVLATNDTITLGTTALTFTQFNGLGQVTAGAGLTKTGNQIDAVGTANRITVNADSIDIASTYAGQNTITTLGTITTGTWNGSTIGVTYGGTGRSTAFTQGSVIFAGAGGALTEDNPQLFWDDTNNRLGVGTTTPNQKITIATGANVAAGITFWGNGGTSSSEVFVGQGSGSEAFFYNRGNNILTLGTNNTERVRITSAGDVGIGTIEPRGKLEIYSANAAQVFKTDESTSGYTYTQGLDDTGVYFKHNSSSRGFRWISNDIERMRIDSNGNIGIGTTTPNEKLDVKGTIRLSNVVTSANYSMVYDGGGLVLLSGNSNPMVFYISAAERARFDSNGDFMVGKTGVNIGTTGCELRQNGVAQFTVNFATTNEAINFNNINTGNIPYDLAFRQQGTVVGYIRVSSTTTAYNTSSDYRLKENIQPMVGALDKIKQLNPVTYNWKNTGQPGQGFIAHELQEIVPDAVTGEKDAVGADGNPKYQGVDTSFLVATLTAAIQELTAKVEAQAAEIAALKANKQGPTV